MRLTLEPEEKSILIESIKLFIQNDIEGIPQQRKLQINTVAFNTITMLNNKESDFTESHFLIMYNALEFFKDNATEANINTNDININADSSRFNLIVTKLMNIIDDYIG